MLVKINLPKIILLSIFSLTLLNYQAAYACLQHERELARAVIEKNIITHKLNLPKPATLKASFAPYVLSKNMVYISGQLPMGFGDITKYQGQLGKEINLEQGQ